jgi:hypothetical protein
MSEKHARQLRDLSLATGILTFCLSQIETIVDFLPEVLPAEAMDKVKQAHKLIVDARRSGFAEFERVSKEAKEGG